MSRSYGPLYCSKRAWRKSWSRAIRHSLDSQREASEAYIKSQAHEGWRLIRDHYDDGGFSCGSMDRPALQKLLIDVQAKRIDVIVVYRSTG
jgi:site-specific DNA recombinase